MTYIIVVICSAVHYTTIPGLFIVMTGRNEAAGSHELSTYGVLAWLTLPL